MYKYYLILPLSTLYAAIALAHEPHHGDHDDMWHAPPQAAARPNPVPADAASIARGKAIYDQNCVVCHGATGKGDSALAVSINPPPADLAVHAPLHSDGDLAWKIAEGRGAMPAWKGRLSEREIWDVVNHIKVNLADETAMAQAGTGIDHSQMGHGAMDHDAMHPMGPSVTTGPWSYQDRDNPQPHRSNRWEMVPVPGSTFMYIKVDKLTSGEGCAALIDNPRIMVDRQTRAACGEVPPSAVAPARAPAYDEHRHQH